MLSAHIARALDLPDRRAERHGAPRLPHETRSIPDPFSWALARLAREQLEARNEQTPPGEPIPVDGTLDLMTIAEEISLPYQ